MNKMLVLVLLVVGAICLKKYYCGCQIKKGKQKVEKVADLTDIIEIQHDKVNFSEAHLLGDQQQV